MQRKRAVRFCYTKRWFVAGMGPRAICFRSAAPLRFDSLPSSSVTRGPFALLLINIMTKEMPRTLIVHHRSGIGDLVWHIPYIRAMAATSAGGKVTVLARPSCMAADVLAGEDCVEAVMEYDRRPRNKARKGRHEGLAGQLQFLQELRRKKFDRIFIFSGRARYGVLALLAGIPIRAGFGFGMAQRLFLNTPPYIERFRGIGSWVYPEATDFAVAHGLVSGAIVPKMNVPTTLVNDALVEIADLPRPRIALAIGSSSAEKDWGGERFLQLAKTLVKSGCGILLLGGPSERETAERLLASAIDIPPGSVRVMCQPSVLKSAAALKACDFCIGNDTGILNVAVACDVPALGLFGSTRPLTHDPLLHAIHGQGMSDISVVAVVDRLTDVNAPLLLAGAQFSSL